MRSSQVDLTNLCIVNHFQINRLKKIVLEIDEQAFIFLQDVSDIIKKRA